MDDVDEFARLFTGFLERMQATGAARSEREGLRERLRAHLGVDPEQVPVVAAAYPSYDLPNVQRAVEAWFDGHELVGLSGANCGHHSLGELLELDELDDDELASCTDRLEPTSTRVIFAGNVLPGKASTVKLASCPSLTWPTSASSIATSSFMADRSSAMTNSVGVLNEAATV